MTDTMPAMHLKSMPLETAAEVLQYLADQEELEGLAAAMHDEMTHTDVKTMLRELAVQLRRIALACGEPYEPQDDKNLKAKVRKMLTCLSPTEAQSILTQFGLAERR
jgi:hypothetical protein